MEGTLTLKDAQQRVDEWIKTIGVRYFNELTNKALITGIRTKRTDPYGFEADLSEKELRILRLMCEEKTTKEIADIVDISPRTVEAIRDKLKTKTGAKSMAGLVMYAVRNGVLEQPN